jgi:hypothetical protein
VKVSFIELNDTIPVHGRDEIHEDLLWGPHGGRGPLRSDGS